MYQIPAIFVIRIDHRMGWFHNLNLKHEQYAFSWSLLRTWHTWRLHTCTRAIYLVSAMMLSFVRIWQLLSQLRKIHTLVGGCHLWTDSTSRVARHNISTIEKTCSDCGDCRSMVSSSYTKKAWFYFSRTIPHENSCVVSHSVETEANLKPFASGLPLSW